METRRFGESEHSLTCAHIVLKKHLKGLTDLSSLYNFNDKIDQIGKSVAYRENIYVIGVGKNRYIAQSCASTMVSVGINAYSPSVEDLLHGSLRQITEVDTVLFLSKSGTTIELIDLVEHLQEHTLRVLITEGKKDKFEYENYSNLISHCDYYIEYPKTEECDSCNFVPTVSLMLTQVVCHMIVATISYYRENIYKDFFISHPGGKIGEQKDKIHEEVWSKSIFLPYENVELDEGRIFI